jgi:hypothetical protein
VVIVTKEAVANRVYCMPDLLDRSLLRLGDPADRGSSFERYCRDYEQ